MHLTKTSHHYGGFWFHITWNGDSGIDQHGSKWVNESNPTPANRSWLKPLCQIVTDVISLIGKNKAA